MTTNFSREDWYAEESFIMFVDMIALVTVSVDAVVAA